MAYPGIRLRTRPLWLLGGILWVASLAVGVRALVGYENGEGAAGTPPAHWPGETHIPRRQHTFSLVMFAHPDCSCTRASLEEIGTLPPALRGKLDEFLEFRKPGSTTRDAQSSALWKTASEIPGLAVAFDGDGREARLFGAYVSGQTVLYDGDGDLVFSGGVTAMRGHVGDNIGMQAVLLRVTGFMTPLRHTPVFGCSLRDPLQAERERDPSWIKQ